MNAPRPSLPDLPRRLVAGLGPLADRLSGRDDGGHLAGPYFSTYCALTRERLRAVETEHPILCVVMSGRKEVWIGDRDDVAGAGSVLVFPPHTRMDIVNVPDDRTGLYESIIVELRELPPPPPGRTPPEGAGRIRVTLTEDLADALVHTARTALSPDHRDDLCLHRLNEVLLLMAEDPAAAPLFDRSLAQRVLQAVAADPGRNWRVEDLAAEMGMAASTLRRRLGAEGRPFREVLRGARMACARQLLESGRASVGEAAGVAGYASRSHFARRYRAAFGQLPRETRAG